jgi:hypothetical protein
MRNCRRDDRQGVSCTEVCRRHDAPTKQSFEELGIHHEEHKVPSKVLASIEEKSKKAATKNATAIAELKKRKGASVSRATRKKQKIVASIATAYATASSASSAGASTDADEGIAENSGGGPTLAGAEEMSSVPRGLGGDWAVGVDHPEPLL